MASGKQTKSSDNKRDKQSDAKKRTTKITAPQAQAPGPELVQLALADPSAVAPSVILALQRSHGNQAVQRLTTQSKPGTARATKKSASTTVNKASASAIMAATVQRFSSESGSTARSSTLTASPESLSITKIRVAPTVRPAPVSIPVVKRSASQTRQVTSRPEPAPQAVPLPEQSLLGVPIPDEDYVPPIAPPALPPPDDDPWHRVGSPYRHLDGISNRKLQTKFTIGPTWRRYEPQTARQFGLGLKSTASFQQYSEAAVPANAFNLE